MVKAENQTLLYLKDANENKFPKPIQFTDGSFVKILKINNKETICRMLTFLEGELMGNEPPTEKLFKSLGVFLAELNLKLKNFENDTIKARVWEWNIQYLNLNKKFIQDISIVKNRSIAEYFLQQFEEHVTPVLPDLRKCIIHNDANDWNFLVNNGTISGIFDFGDLAYSPLINELAVAITYGSYNKDNPLKWALIILKSYHNILPIEEKENELPRPKGTRYQTEDNFILV